MSKQITYDAYVDGLKNYQDKKRNKLSKNTIKWYSRAIEVYFKNGMLEMYTDKGIDALVDEMNKILKRKNEPILKSAFRHYLIQLGCEQKIVDSLDTVAQYKTALTDEEELKNKLLEEREVKRIIKGCGNTGDDGGVACRYCSDRKLSLIIRLFVETGMRKGELLGLRVKDIDFKLRSRDDEKGEVARETGLYAEISIEGAKGNKSRKVYIRKYVTTELLSLLKREGLGAKGEGNDGEGEGSGTDKVFTLYKGDGHPSNGAYANQDYELWNKIRKRAECVGIEEVFPHMFRHYLGTALSEAGADGNEVQAILGHSDLRTTQIYMKMTDKKRLLSFGNYSKKMED